jgi:DNA polymerase epsilon subunit 1
LNWEQTAIQLSFESYLYTTVIAFPKRVAYARYGHIPIGNLGDDENSVLYESALSRLLQKNRVVSWSSAANGQPDLGVKFLSGPGGGSFPKVHDSSYLCSQDEIWGDDDDLVSPVLRKPGCYRNVCIDIDVQDLAIAALTDFSSLPTIAAQVTDPNSPNTVTFLDGGSSVQKQSGPLGDEMSTSTSLPILRALVVGWLRDAFAAGSLVADELLHHVYRLVSSTDGLLYDTALHRIVHELMKSTFFRLLGELQRLGCSIVFASFHRITVATNKLHLHQAQEYIDFVISTVRKRAAAMSGSAGEDALSRVSLQPRQFHSHFVFLDEFNFGTIHLTQLRKEDVKEDDEFVLPVEDDPNSVVVPSVVTAWGLMNYLGSSDAQEYFRAIIGRFSSDVFRKQMELVLADDGIDSSSVSSQLLQFKKVLVKKSFAAYLTRALDEIVNDTDDPIPPPLLLDANATRSISPAIEFVKNVGVVLELDSDVEDEAHSLKRSLLAQLGVAEYARVAQWANPCPSYTLPDVFCVECHDSRDVNLCYIPPREVDEDYQRTLVCEDCGTPIDSIVVEKRLISLLHRKLARFQLQDVRCVRSNRVITRALNPNAETTSGMKLDISPSDALRDVRLLGSLAEFYSLQQLRGTTEGILSSFNSSVR